MNEFDDKPGQRRATEQDRRIGLAIREQRLSHGLTQEQLSEALGITYQQVQKYEKGTNRMSAIRLHQICEVLGVPVTHFYDAMNPDPVGAAEDPSVELDAGQEAALVRAFRRVKDPRVRSQVLAFARAMASR